MSLDCDVVTESLAGESFHQILWEHEGKNKVSTKQNQSSVSKVIHNTNIHKFLALEAQLSILSDNRLTILSDNRLSGSILLIIRKSYLFCY